MIVCKKLVTFCDKISVLEAFPLLEKAFILKNVFFSKKRLQLLLNFCIIVQVD